MKKLIIRRTFNAPIDKVWDSFTVPELLRKWWSPEGMDSSYISVELKKNGLFRYCFKGMDETEMTIIGDNYYDESMTENMIKGWNSMFDKLISIL